MHLASPYWLDGMSILNYVGNHFWPRLMEGAWIAGTQSIVPISECFAEASWNSWPLRESANKDRHQPHHHSILRTCLNVTIVGPCPHRHRDYHIGSNFWKFNLTRTSFTLGEPFSLVKVFRLFRLDRIFLVFRVWTQYIDVEHLIYWQGQCVCDALLDRDRHSWRLEMFAHNGVF
jgi:hypothetical protein